MTKDTWQNEGAKDQDSSETAQPFLSALASWVGETADRISRSLSYAYDIEEVDIERHLEAAFAQEFGAWTLTRPRLSIQADDRLTLEADIVRRRRQDVRDVGQLTLTGHLVYVPDSGLFFVQRIRLRDLRLGGMRRCLVPVKPLLQWWLRRWLRKNPVFRFEAGNPGHVWVHRYLDRVECRPGRLRLQLRRAPNGATRILKP